MGVTTAQGQSERQRPGHRKVAPFRKRLSNCAQELRDARCLETSAGSVEPGTVEMGFRPGYLGKICRGSLSYARFLTSPSNPYVKQVVIRLISVNKASPIAIGGHKIHCAHNHLICRGIMPVGEQAQYALR